MPFLYHHYVAYITFCRTLSKPASWCSNIPPSIYTHVQSTYWNVGFLRYWTLQQLPNFIISTPPLILLFYFSIYSISQGLIPQLISYIQSDRPQTKTSSRRIESPFLSSSESLHPHTIHALFLCTTLVFTSHTQIVLRLGPSMPVTYWAAAWLVVEKPRYGRWWIRWSVVWSVISAVLWGVFLPPA
jgi:phosphatidylinositol glycan class V